MKYAWLFIPQLDSKFDLNVAKPFENMTLYLVRYTYHDVSLLTPCNLAMPYDHIPL